MKKLFWFSIMLFLTFFLPYKVNAECSDKEIIRLQNLAKNVNYSYEYNENTKKFSITFNNLKKDIVLKDDYNNRNYNVDGEVTFNDRYSNTYRFYIYAKDNKCINDVLTTKVIKLPVYNNYYNNSLCQGIEDYSYCNKWINNNVSYDIWYKKVTEYRKTIQDTKENKKEVKGIFDGISEILMKVYVNYYYIILPLIIITLCTIIYFKNKKDDLV